MPIVSTGAGAATAGEEAMLEGTPLGELAGVGALDASRSSTDLRLLAEFGRIKGLPETEAEMELLTMDAECMSVSRCNVGAPEA